MTLNGYTIEDIHTEQTRLNELAMHNNLNRLYEATITAQIEYNTALKAYNGRS